MVCTISRDRSITIETANCFASSIVTGVGVGVRVGVGVGSNSVKYKVQLILVTSLDGHMLML